MSMLWILTSIILIFLSAIICLAFGLIRKIRILKVISLALFIVGAGLFTSVIAMIGTLDFK